MTDENNGNARVVPLKPKKCPLCNRPEVQAFRPFCSKRCADLDLGSWLNESYRIPGDEHAVIDDDSPDEN